MDLPILPETYWNPYKKELVVDRQLGHVITSPKWSIEESKKATEESWSVPFPTPLSLSLSFRCSVPHSAVRLARVEELETQGMLTSRILGSLPTYPSPSSLTSLLRATDQREDQQVFCVSVLLLLRPQQHLLPLPPLPRET
jgi:hypothetical protein